MNYNSAVTKEINQFAPNEIIVARKLYQEKLAFVPEATYFKVLGRIMKEHKLARISKGVYCRPKATRFGIVAGNENETIRHYTGEGNEFGVVVGYKLYNKYGLTTQISRTTEIYSSLISEKKKVIENILIRQISLPLNQSKVAVIEALEIMQNYKKLEDISAAGFKAYLTMFASRYDNMAALEVLSRMNYQKRTIAFMRMVLEYFNVKNTLSIYLAATSNYKTPKMDEIL